MIFVLRLQKFVHIIDVISVNSFQLGSWVAHCNNIFKNICNGK